MKNTITVFTLVLSLTLFSQQPFDCDDGNFYQVISGAMKAYDPITGSYSESLHSYSSYNAGGYNSQDNFLYAIKSKDKHLLRIAKDMVIDLGAILPAGSVAFGGGYAADVDPEGNLWVFQNTNKKTFHKILNLKNYDNSSAPVFEVITADVASPSTCADIAYVNGSFYGGSRGKLYQWDLSTGTPVFSSKTVENLPNGTFGAAYADANNRLYLSDNNGGLYLINDYQGNAPTATLLNLTETTNSNDGFKCANGISPLDKDQDGILDSMDLDADGDGISNIIECKGINPYGDADDDNLYNYLDNDSSGNGDNVVQDAFDRDGDGIPDFFDIDSDNDGIYDIVEAGQGDKDTNNDGIYNGLDTGFSDTNFDGLADIYDPNTNGTPLVLRDTDNDGVFDCYDIDADNDGIIDIVEGQNAASYKTLSYVDADNDGLDDAFDQDYGGTTNGTVNTDGTDAYDYLDTDSDNDGTPDQIAAYDIDGDGIAEITPSGTDEDQDGLDTSFDLRKSSFDPQNGSQTPTSFPVPAICDRYKYLGDFNSDDGTPLYLDTRDEISSETLQIINDALPEGYPVPDFNPHYISSGYDTEIKINETTDVWVTFVGEGAGYKNTLGFYTYDINNPTPSVPAPEDITIIFPNVSAVDSGGGLRIGDKVNIGSFSPNTGIGWVLLANAWSDGCIGTGNWQLHSNHNYNPESNQSLKYHNVLLADRENERIILGFEDIRRDYSSCDHDFNDALFYITTNTYSAMKTNNLVSIEDATDVTSANDGGLESNGDLAKLIAKRNFKRVKTNSTQNTKKAQKKFTRAAKSSKKSDPDDMSSYFPTTGVNGTETTSVSSPEDLVDITNANSIFSLDYYLGESRVAAGLATTTTGAIYDHSKTICDRLNGSKLLDVRTMKIRNYTLVSTKIERATKEVEYTLSFSIKKEEAENEIYSLWNIADYPAGDYMNFQIWGSSIPQVANIANNVIDNLLATKPLRSHPVDNRIPSVFVQKGEYINGKLILDIVNKYGSNSIDFEGNLRDTEQSEERTITKNVVLSGAYEEQVIVETGNLFDIGFSISGTYSPKQDALYLADGPWGIDYLKDDVVVESFDIQTQHSQTDDTEDYWVERNVNLQGEIKGTINIFRNILAGDNTLDVSNHKGISFTMNTDIAVEVIIVTKDLVDWNNRLRYQIASNTNKTLQAIRFDQFVDNSGATQKVTDIRSIVFSIQGDYNNYKNFEVALSDLKIFKSNILSNHEVRANTASTKIVNFPNPFSTQTTLQIPNTITNYTITVFDLLGRVVQKEEKTANARQETIFEAKNLQNGIYKYRITNDKNLRYTGSFAIQKQ